MQGTDYYVPDNLGSTTSLLTSGSVARSWTYDPDGTPTSSGSGASTDILYADGQSLSNGLTHFGARFYNPALGRWTQPDPLNQISDLTQANRYAYVGGDPVDGVDPSGEGPAPCRDGRVSPAGRAGSATKAFCRRYQEDSDHPSAGCIVAIEGGGATIAGLMAEGIPEAAAAKILAGSSGGADIYGLVSSCA